MHLFKHIYVSMIKYLCKFLFSYLALKLHYTLDSTKTLVFARRPPSHGINNKTHWAFTNSRPLPTWDPWPIHFKHSHWWKRWSQSKFASHYAWGTNAICECKMNVKSTWLPTWHQMDHVSWSLALFFKITSWSRSNTKPGDQSTPNAHNHWFILFYHVWGSAWIEIHWNEHLDWGSGHIWLHTTPEGPWLHHKTLEMYWDGPWTHLFGLSQFLGHGSWLMWEVALKSGFELRTMWH